MKKQPRRFNTAEAFRALKATSETTQRRERLRSLAEGISVVNMGPRFTKKRKKAR